MATEYTYKLDDFLKDQLPELPGVSRSVALKELRLTLREFFEKSFAWTASVKDVALVTGETPIQVSDGDSNTEVIGILHVAIGDSTGYRDLIPLSKRPIDEETTDNDPDYWYITSNPDELCLYPYMNNASSKDLTVLVALMPAFTIDANTATLPRQIMSKYYDAIEEGFLARMYQHPNKPYSAPMLAQQKRHNFLRAIGYYAGQRKQGYNGAPDWRYPRGWSN